MLWGINMLQNIKIDDGSAMFVCPECFKTKTVNVSKQCDKSGIIKVNCKCPCGHEYPVMLDKRKYDREVVTLPGVFIRYAEGNTGNSEQMLVLDLSLSGLRFMIKTKCNIKIKEELMVEFNLNDKEKSLIKEKVVVKYLKTNEVGAKFCSKVHQDKIKPYLKSLDSKAGQ